MSFGISAEDKEYIIETIKIFPEVEKAMIFGSRAMGSFKIGSDVDIALFGDQVNFSVVAKIKDRLQEESPMPYLFDIVDYTHTESEALKEHIDRVGQLFYQKKQ